MRISAYRDRGEGIAVHEDVQLRLFGRDVALEIPARFKKFGGFRFRHEHVGGSLGPYFVTGPADFRDLSPRLIIFSVQFYLRRGIREAEISRAGFCQDIELLTPHLFESEDCLRGRDLGAETILARNWNRLFDRDHLVGKGIWRDIDITTDFRCAGDPQVIPRAFLNNALLRGLPFAERFPDCWVPFRDNARDFPERKSTPRSSWLVGSPDELSWQR